MGRWIDFQHGQFEKAAELLIQSGRFREALDLCMANSVTITEELAERMTITKTPNGWLGNAPIVGFKCSTCCTLIPCVQQLMWSLRQLLNTWDQCAACTVVCRLLSTWDQCAACTVLCRHESVTLYELGVCVLSVYVSHV